MIHVSTEKPGFAKKKHGLSEHNQVYQVAKPVFFSPQNQVSLIKMHLVCHITLIL